MSNFLTLVLMITAACLSLLQGQSWQAAATWALTVAWASLALRAVFVLRSLSTMFTEAQADLDELRAQAHLLMARRQREQDGRNT